MKQKHKSVYMYTHTHTHTINFVYLLRTAPGRCLQWVSAFWQGIRRWAERSGTGRTPETIRQHGQSHWASHRSGCWYLIRMGCPSDIFMRPAAEAPTGFTEGLRLQGVRHPHYQLWTGALLLFTIPIFYAQITRVWFLTTSTARNCRRKVAA